MNAADIVHALLTSGLLLVGVIVLLAAASRLRRGRVGGFALRPGSVALACIVVGAWTVRTIGADAFLTPTHHAALMATIALEELTNERTLGELLAYWRGLLTSFQGLSLVDRSAFALPVDALVYRLVGPVLAFPTVAGAVWGTAAVALGWAVGRRIAGASVGLAFAALLAASPVQIVWSRIGGLYVTSVPHVLGALWLALACVERRSVGLALLTGACCWSTLYGYYAARIAIPVCGWTIATWGRPAPPWRTRLALLLGWLAPFAVAYLLWGSGLLETLWPLVGFRFFPHADASNVLGASFEAIRNGARDTFRLLFVSGRVSAWDPPGWETTYGGAIPLGVAALGILGLARALIQLRRFHVWLVLVALSLLPSVLSTAEVRRLLVFDMGWQLLAAVGMVSLGRLAPRRFRVPIAALGLVAFAWWSTALVVRLTAGSTKEISSIPFGAGTAGENTTCRGCMWRTRRWRDAVAGGQAVVVFDNDAARDDRQFHLRTYGYVRLAALGGGHANGAWDFYEVVRNVRDRWTLATERLWTDDWVPFLRRELSAPWIDGVLWHFANPTSLERQAIANLAQIGGRVSRVRLPFDAADTLGERWQQRLDGEVIEVATAPDALDAALGAVARALGPAPVGFTAPVTAARVTSRTLAAPATDLVGTRNVDGRIAWAAMMPAAIDVDGQTRASELLVTVAGREPSMNRDGDFLAIAMSGRRLSWRNAPAGSDAAFQRLLPVGYRCAAVAGDHWFVVDAESGALRSDVDVGWLPARTWVGVATAGGQLVLASAAQELVVAELETRRVIGTWSVPVWRGPRRMYGECSTVLVADAWYATYDWATGRAAVLDRDGTARGMLGVQAAVGGAIVRIDAVGAAGDRLGVAYTIGNGHWLNTLRVAVGQGDGAGGQAHRSPTHRSDGTARRAAGPGPDTSSRLRPLRSKWDYGPPR